MKTVGLRRAAAVVVAFGAAGLARAAEGPATTAATDAEQQMMAQIRQLQAKVDRLEQRQSPAPTVPAPAAVPSAAPTDRLARPRRGDSDPLDSSRPVPPPETVATTGPSGSTFSAITAGWDGNQFVLRSADGSFTLHPGIVVDVRDLLDYRERVPAKGGGSEVKAGGFDAQNGLDVTRLRLLLDGTLFRHLSYLVQFQADQGQTLGLFDAVATYRVGDDGPFSVKAGQFKDPVWHERNLSEAYLMAVDRSLTEQFLAGGQGSRVQGGAVTFDRDRTRAQLVAHDGFNSANTKFFDAGGVPSGVGGAAGVSPTNYGFSGRVEYLLLGDRTKAYNPYLEYDQFSSLHARQDVLVVGAGADYSQASSNDVVLHSADVQYNSVSGLSAYGAFYGTYRKVKANQGVSPAGFYYDDGFEAQVAYLIPGTQLEPFGRYDLVHLDPSSTRQVTGLATHVVQEVTVGANYYVYGQKLKLTVDADYLPSGSPADVDAFGVLKDSGNNQFVLRAQVQLAI